MSGFFVDQPEKPKPVLPVLEPKDPPVKRWSFSAIKSFEACPLRIQFARVDKIPRIPPEPDSPLGRGSRIHEEIENHIRTGEAIPTFLKGGESYIDQARQAFLDGIGFPELDLGFDANWNLVDLDHPNLWLRAILDVFILESPDHAVIIDWKSGKSWQKEVAHSQQAQLYAACAFRAHPGLQTVKSAFVYVDEKDKALVRIYSRLQASVFENSFHNRGVRLTTATEFPPKPNQINCKWCDYGQSHGNAHCVYDVFRDDCIRPSGGHLRQRFN